MYIHKHGKGVVTTQFYLLFYGRLLARYARSLVINIMQLSNQLRSLQFRVLVLPNALAYNSNLGLILGTHGENDEAERSSCYYTYLGIHSFLAIIHMA